MATEMTGDVAKVVTRPRCFVLRRHEDETGVSTALGAEAGDDVAWGVEFPDGVCVTRWAVTDIRQTCVWASIAEVLAVHGHGGKTELVWTEYVPPPDWPEGPWSFLIERELAGENDGIRFCMYREVKG